MKHKRHPLPATDQATSPGEALATAAGKLAMASPAPIDRKR